MNDVVVLCSASPYEYIQNGYEELQYGEFRYPEYWNGGYSVDFNEEYVPVEKETGFFGEDGVKMMLPSCGLFFQAYTVRYGQVYNYRHF